MKNLQCEINRARNLNKNLKCREKNAKPSSNARQMRCEVRVRSAIYKHIEQFKYLDDHISQVSDVLDNSNEEVDLIKYISKIYISTALSFDRFHQQCSCRLKAQCF